MADYDLVIKGGTVVTAADTVACDIGIKDGKVAAIKVEPGQAVEVGTTLVVIE